MKPSVSSLHWAGSTDVRSPKCSTAGLQACCRIAIFLLLFTPAAIGNVMQSTPEIYSLDSLPFVCLQALSVPRDDTVLHALQHGRKCQSDRASPPPHAAKHSKGKSWMQRSSQYVARQELRTCALRKLQICFSCPLLGFLKP